MIILQANDEGFPSTGDTYAAFDGCIQNDLKYEFVKYEDLPKYVDKRNPTIGTVEYVQEAFRLLGIPIPRLPRNSNRESLLLTLKEALELRESSNTNIFLKPKDNIKAFTGFTHEGYNYPALDKVSKDTLVLVYDPFPSPLLTEWRAYIHSPYLGIIDIRNYSGDFFLMPDKRYIEDIVRVNKKDFPVAYSLDVGILADGSNVVIEYNDFWALGNYGMPNWIYLRCLVDRWREIVNGR